MRRRAPLATLLIGATVAGFLAIGLVRAAGSGPDLGEPVVVSQTPMGSTRSRPDRTPSGEPPAATSTPTATSGPSKQPAASPSARRTKAEPVPPPSPRPGGDDDDDDDDGGDDD
ncbi:hypothetical protein [Nonomuraea sp. LPB2021202275-12-8]|uniref:hypothetical protein n=1 Tax=Nonomuraea sp. LPB2021202275-12-8 TaxID=3120159 RepID=UPI00300D250D